MKAVIYIRVSTTEQAEEGYSIRAQRGQLVDYCRVNDLEVVNIYIDDGYSAKDINRPQLKSLLKDAEDGLFDAVVVYKLDRFTRSVKDLYELLEHLKKYNVDFISKQEKFDTSTAMGKAMIGILGVFAQFERELIAERVRMGMEQKVKEGKRPGGKFPYGYDKQSNLIPEEKEVLRYLRYLYVTERLGFKNIAIRLNNEGKLRRGFLWRASTVALTLENPFYAGIIEFGGKMPNGKYPARKRELRVEVIRMDGSHEPVYTREEFAEHIALMRSRSDSGYSRKMEYWFTGLLRCGYCGGSMHGRLTTKRLVAGKEVRTAYYICSNRKENESCKQPIFRQVHIEHLVMDYIKKIPLDQNLTKQARSKMVVQENDRQKQIAKLRRDLENVKERVKKWQYMFVEELVTADDLRKRLDEEYQKETAIRNDLEELQRQGKETVEIQSKLKNIADIWDQLTDLEKKDILYDIFEEIKVITHVINPKGVKNKFFDASIQVKYR